MSRARAALVMSVTALAAACFAAPAAAADSVTDVAHRAAQADDSFYIPPSPLPDGSPGDVIRTRPVETVWPGVEADGWQVMYRSTNALGEPAAMTGTVLVPDGVDPATAPIVAFGPGTQGPAFRCAPSKMIASGAFYEQAGLRSLFEAGYAVAVPDYEGYHPDPAMTYITGESMGAATIDVVRAAQRIPESGLSDEAKVAFRGYSQGGGAALWAGQMQPEYAPDMRLVGVSAGGVPADPIEVALPLEGGEGFGFMLMALIGFDNAYPELQLDSYLNEAGRTAVSELESDGCTWELLTEYAGKSLNDFTSSSPVLNEDWMARYPENTLGADPPTVPVFQYHGTADNIVAPGQAETLRNTYCEAGVDLTWKAYDFDHITGVYVGNADSLAFLDARMNGEPAGSNC